MKSSAFWLAVAAALALAGCAQEQAPSPSTTRTRPLESSAPAQFDLQRERALKEQAQPARRRVHPIDWSEAAKYPQIDVATLALDAEARARLEHAPLPALVPQKPALFRKATITSGPHWYAASLHADGYSVYVSGTNLETVIPELELPKRHPELKNDFRITRTDGIVTLTFNAFGAAYDIDVECARPTTDARCTQDDFAVALANSLAVANRGGQR